MSIPTAAQTARQHARHHDGRYAEMPLAEGALQVEEPIPAWLPTGDARVRSGELAPPAVIGVDGTRWERADHYQGHAPYAIRLQADRPLTSEEAQRLAQLAGYQYRATIAGESLGWPDQDTPASIVVGADTTKSRRDDLGQAMADFESGLGRIVAEGSPVRKTDRAGAGTKGTRLVEGLGAGLLVTIYYEA